LVAACVAAKGVLFLEPLKPIPPALAHAIAFPNLSARVMRVLLKLAFTKAIPSASTFYLFFFTVLAN
jgi:hypothetical protein